MKLYSRLAQLLFLFLLFFPFSSLAYDTDGDGVDTMADAIESLKSARPYSAIHSLQIQSGESPYPLVLGSRGVPQDTFTLPAKNDGEGYYYPDIQASFPDVNWQELDRLYIPAGNYKFVLIKNLPERENDDPLVITNIGGQVRVGGYGHYYLFILGGGRNWVLTGRHDPISLTGDSSFPGHWDGNYGGSRDSYGFLVDDDQSGPSGVAIGGRATDFEVEFVEVREVGFAGMLIKTDDDGTATMSNVKIHDNYIHDTLSEGFYIGSTQSQPQHRIEDMEIYNNRLIRTGTEAIQIGNLGGNVSVRNNIFALSAIHWKDAFQAWQDGNLQLGNRTGDVEIVRNIFIGAAGNLAFLSGSEVSGDDYPATSTVRFAHNYFASTRNLFFYIRGDQFPGLHYVLEENYFTHWQFQRNEIDPGATPPQNVIRSFTPAPLEFHNNIWDVELNFCNQLSTGNGEQNNVSGSGNAKQTVPAIRFRDTGLSPGFDMLKVEVWAENASRATSQPHPVSYKFDDIAMHYGRPYRCRLETCEAGNIPPDNPAIWEELPYPADDYRLSPESDLQGIGLLY